ncbi:MAG: SpoIIE family protein phosphatase [Chitinivibrionales bacterium]|nr:SpoIIE family protein phosphatase [Chitinivibrionales bacterium]
MKKTTSKNPSEKPDDPAGLRRRIADLEESQRRLKELVERQSHEQVMLRTLIDTMPDYIFIKDKESRFVVNNNAHLRILGADDQTAVTGKTDFDIFPHDLAARYFSDEQVVLQTGKSIIGREEPLPGTGEKQMWLSTTKVAVKNAAGEIVGLVGISRDITDRKRFEADLKAAKDELEVRVLERTLDLKKANEGLATRIDQLHFLNTTFFNLAQHIRINELGEGIIAAFVARFPHAECALCLPQKQKFMVLCATKGLSGPAAHSSAQEALALTDEAQLKRPLLVEDWRADRRIGKLTWPEMERLPCYVAIPLLADNKAIGIVQIFTTAEFKGLYESELPILDTLAIHAAACLSNALYYQELGRHERLQGELDAARSIQQRFTPRDIPSIPHVKVQGVYYPAHEVGGDYLDYFQTDNGSWVIAIADVCGKGIPAALFMTMLRSAFRILGSKARSAKALLCAVNDALKLNFDEKAYVTVLCLVINKEGTAMTYARAGHPKLLHWQNRKQMLLTVECKGIALGLVQENNVFADILEEVTIPLQSRDRFLIYTDGLTEATDPDRKSFGLQRVLDLLSAAPACGGPEKQIERIMADVKRFTQDTPYHDDLTILAMEVE